MYKPCAFLGKDNLDQRTCRVLCFILKITKEINYDLWAKGKESLLKTKEEAQNSHLSIHMECTGLV